MRIAELYASLQGEGLLTGTPSVFVRASGCNLRCHWCDTPFTSWNPVGDEWGVERIAAAVAATGLRHVVLTGGEPLLFADAVPLLTALRGNGLHVTVETAGTLLPEALPEEPWTDLMSVSPKLASSAPAADAHPAWHRRHGAARRRDAAILGLLAAGPWQLKFVVGSGADLDEALGWLADLERARGAPLDRRRVFLMPEGTDPAALERTAAWLEPACRAEGVAFGARHHIDWFGHTRGT